MAKKLSETSQLAKQLRDWAIKYKCSNQLIDELAVAIESKKDLHKWADLDPFEYLPMPSSEQSSRKLKTIERFTVLRNVLVFAPVALTWAAVGQATSAFEKYVSENQTAVVNFLQFWQNGYEVLPEFWRLADVARLDFYIIVVVIALTILTSYQSQKLADTENKLSANVENDRQFMAAKIALFMSDKKKITNVTFNQSLAGSVQRLQNAASALEKTAKEMNKASKKLPKID